MLWYKKKERMEAFRSWASEKGWKYVEQDDMGTLKWLEDFSLFKYGSGRKIGPMMMLEEDDLTFRCLFDYTYTVSTGKSSATYWQTVFFRYSKKLALPHFIMVPEKWYHRVGTYFGMQDIDFVQYPEFSQNYLLRGKDEEYIRHHFDHPDMIRFFDTQDFYSMEGVNYLMIMYVSNKVLPKEQALQLVNIGNRLHDFLADKTPGIELPPGIALEEI